jgi:hypothetical protein
MAQLSEKNENPLAHVKHHRRRMKKKGIAHEMAVSIIIAS